MTEAEFGEKILAFQRRHARCDGPKTYLFTSRKAVCSGCDRDERVPMPGDDDAGFRRCGADLDPLGRGTERCALPLGHDGGCKKGATT